MNYERLRRIVPERHQLTMAEEELHQQLARARVVWKIEDTIHNHGLTMSVAAKAMDTTVARLKDMTARRLDKFTEEELENYLKRLLEKKHDKRK